MLTGMPVMSMEDGQDLGGETIGIFSHAVC